MPRHRFIRYVQYLPDGLIENKKGVETSHRDVSTLSNPPISVRIAVLPVSYFFKDTIHLLSHQQKITLVFSLLFFYNYIILSTFLTFLQFTIRSE